MNGLGFRLKSFRVVSAICVLLLTFCAAGALLMAQAPAPAPPPAQQLSPEQLDTLVAPVALYPDSLLGQVFVAATYPLEVVEAKQWLQQNGSLRGTALVNAAQQQNWDPSVQALVVFPDVLDLLNSNVRWTTDLGNAFLAQQADVMSAVQRMRERAQAEGRLNSNNQQIVTTQTQNGQPAIEITPANPEVVYVPVYDPAYIWGPPTWGYYPPLYYPAFGFGWGPGIYIGGFFGGLGWGGWGWGPNWFNYSVGLNPFFFNHYGFRGFGYGYRDGFRRGFNGGVWAHNPEHRLGVPYSNARIAGRFGGTTQIGGTRQSFGSSRGAVSNFGSRGPGSVSSPGAQGGGWRRFGEPGTSGGRNFQSGVLGNSAGRSAAPSENRGGGSWSRFGSAAPQQPYRSSPAYGGNMARAYSPSVGRSSPAFSGNAYRSAPSFGGGGAYRSAPFSGGGFRGGGGGFRSAPSYGGGGFRGGGGGGFHGGGGGGGSHGGGGGGHRR